MKKSYVTLVNDPTYLAGTRVLAHSLSNTGTNIPLVILASGLEDSDMAVLSGLEAILWPTDHIEVDTAAARNFPARSKTFSKINAWLLTDYDKCVFLDADILVMQNIDYLFDYPEFSAVGSAGYFNTGVFVYEPSRETHELLKNAVAGISEDRTYLDDSEQEMLQRVFRDEFSPLPPCSNFRPYHDRGPVLNILYKWEWSRSLINVIGDEARIDAIHYIGYPKPWEIYLDRYSRDPAQYTWREDELKRVEWAFELWRDAWNEMERSERLSAEKHAW